MYLHKFLVIVVIAFAAGVASVFYTGHQISRVADKLNVISFELGNQNKRMMVARPKLVAHMPDFHLTPGKIRPDCDTEQCCTPGYTATVRHVTTATKKEVFKRYGITDPRPGEYEIDHLISLELCGDNDIENLWPQPYQGEWNAHMKDRLENKLHALVCAGAITLKEAREEISTDWVESYQKRISN